MVCKSIYDVIASLLYLPDFVIQAGVIQAGERTLRNPKGWAKPTNLFISH
jgi:hypothetical protein